MPHLYLKRIYDAPADQDGVRVLVDRLWPRGVSKSEAQLDHWLKDLAPSDGLRQWYDHDPCRFDTFAERYRQELDAAGASDVFKKAVDLRRRITLLTATRDTATSHAAVLRDYLRKHL